MAIAIGLPYGENAQWTQNLMAAGEGHIVRGGRRWRLVAPFITDAHDLDVPGPARLVGRLADRVLIADLRTPLTHAERPHRQGRGI